MAAISTSIKLDPATKDRVQRLASARQRTPHWVMKEAIEQYVAREESREKANLDAVEAWEEYQATGLHVTGDEVIAWMQTWGDENEKPAPECHI